jgi:hypothetical protein
LVSNDESDFYTIVDITANDRLGLLHDLTRTIADHGSEIYISKAATVLDQVTDTFYLKDAQGKKLSDPEEIDGCAQPLLAAAERERPGLSAARGALAPLPTRLASAAALRASRPPRSRPTGAIWRACRVFRARADPRGELTREHVTGFAGAGAKGSAPAARPRVGGRAPVARYLGVEGYSAIPAGHPAAERLPPRVLRPERPPG